MAVEQEKDLICTCGICKGEFPVKGNTTAVPSGDGVTQFGLTCPHCDTFVHSYFETQELAVLRDKLNRISQEFASAPRFLKQKKWNELQTAKQVFQRYFNRVQSRMRLKRGMNLHDRTRESSTESPDNSSSKMEA